MLQRTLTKVIPHTALLIPHTTLCYIGDLPRSYLTQHSSYLTHLSFMLHRILTKIIPHIALLIPHTTLIILFKTLSKVMSHTTLLYFTQHSVYYIGQLPRSYLTTLLIPHTTFIMIHRTLTKIIPHTALLIQCSSFLTQHALHRILSKVIPNTMLLIPHTTLLLPHTTCVT